MKIRRKKLLLVLFAAGVIILARYYNLQEYMTLEALKENRDKLIGYYSGNRFEFFIGYFLFYVMSVAVSLPGATVLTLGAGAIFGLLAGIMLVSFASTIGATFAFLFSRYLFRDLIQKRFADQINTIDRGIKEDGAFYLFTLRMIPLFPFFLINLVMGVTNIRVFTFFFVSQIGMLLGTAVYVNAGTELTSIHSIKDIASPSLLISFSILGVFPLLAKLIVNALRSNKVYSRFLKPKNYDYNMIVIGAGAAGLVSAYIASTVKAKIALIEKHKMGGDCLNYGCVPSKALLAVAKKIHLEKTYSEYGLKSVKIEFNFKDIMKRVAGVVKKIEPNDSIDRYTKLGVDCFSGNAKILTPFEIEINGKILTTKTIIVASGAEPYIPDIPGLNSISYLTSDTIWNLEFLPKNLLILGGGPIGCELSQAFARLGSSVTLLESGERILSREDKDVSSFLAEVLTKEGVQILTSHKVLEFKKSGKSFSAVCESGENSIEINFDSVFIAAGRKARTKGFGLEELGIKLNPDGTIQTDEYMRTNIPNIYACGDAAGPYQFTHTASHQAWFASVNALFGIFKKFKADYRVIPRTTFTDPEIARVGLSEEEAQQKGVSYELCQYNIGELDRAITDGEAHGFIKVLVHKGTDKILGVTIAANQAGELLAEYILAMKHGIGLNKILGTIHTYPTMSEANKYAAGSWKKTHKPEKLLSFVKKFHTWRRR